jgi:DNA-binding response OmpR family regulator
VIPSQPMADTILLVDDSADTEMIVSRALSGPGLELIAAPSAAEGKRIFLEREIRLLLLDIGLPDNGGFNFLLELQADGTKRPAVPVIVVTQKSGTSDKVAAFSMGADDYIVKPFEVLEFRARVMSRIDKLRKSRQQDETFLTGPLVFDLATQRVFDASLPSFPGGRGNDLRLTATEFRLLHHLARRPNRVFSRAQLLDAVWGPEVHVFDRTVDAHVCTLRRKLSTQAGLVESVPGIGYRFKPKAGPAPTCDAGSSLH